MIFHSSSTKRNSRERGPSNYFILCIETIHIFIWGALSCDFLLCIIRSIESFPWLFLCKAFLFSCLDHSQSIVSDWRFILAGISPVLTLCVQAKSPGLCDINPWACPWQSRYSKKPKPFHIAKFCLVNDNLLFGSSSEPSPDTKHK